MARWGGGGEEGGGGLAPFIPPSLSTALLWENLNEGICKSSCAGFLDGILFTKVMHKFALFSYFLFSLQ